MLREACSKWFGQIRQNGWEKEGEREGAFCQELLHVCCRSCFLVSNIVIQHGCPNFRLALSSIKCFCGFFPCYCVYSFHSFYLALVWLALGHFSICDIRLAASILKIWRCGSFSGTVVPRFSMAVILYQQAGLQNLFLLGPVWFRCMSKLLFTVYLSSLHLEPVQPELEDFDSDTVYPFW